VAKNSNFSNFTTYTRYTITVWISYKSYFDMVGVLNMKKGDGSWQNFQLLLKILEKRQNLWQKIQIFLNLILIIYTQSLFG